MCSFQMNDSNDSFETKRNQGHCSTIMRMDHNLAKMSVLSLIINAYARNCSARKKYVSETPHPTDNEFVRDSGSVDLFLHNFLQAPRRIVARFESIRYWISASTFISISLHYRTNLVRYFTIN